MTVAHIENFADAIRNRGAQHSPIDEGHVSVTLCHLGNIAQYTGRTLYLDQRNGHISGDPSAMKLWSREYESGWDMNV